MPAPPAAFAEQYVGRRQVLEAFGICNATLSRWLRGGKFPRPLPVSHRKQVWSAAQLRAALEAMAAQPGGAA